MALKYSHVSCLPLVLSLSLSLLPLQVVFLTRIWNPQVELPSGEMCKDPIRAAWRPNMTLRELLVVVRTIIASPEAGSTCVNAEAGAQLTRSIDEFDKCARAETQKWATE